ncbi:MAG: carbohydrate ABC transporter permease [Christensenellales bacterium]
MTENTKSKKGFWAREKTNKAVNPVYAMASVLPLLLFLALFSFIPAIISIVVSFTDYAGVFSTMQFVGIENYVNVFTTLSGEIFPAFGRTLEYAALVIIPLQIISLGAALLVNMKLRGSNYFRALFFMPSILGTAVICSVWGMMFDPYDSLFSTILSWFGKTSAFLGDENIAMVLIAVIALWASFGYSMAIYLAGLQGVNAEYYEAAEIDGANAWNKFWKITLPLIMPSVTICIFIALQGTLGMSDYIIFLTNGAHGTTTIGFYIYRLTLNSINQGQVAAVSMVNFVFVSSIMLLYNKLMRAKEEQL